MKPHANPITVNSWLLQSRRATEIAIDSANARFDEAMRTCEHAWEAFWASCEPSARGLTFVCIGPGGERFEFKDGWLLPNNGETK